MEKYEGPTDIFGIAIYSALTRKMEEDPEYRAFIENLNMNLIVELDYYPLMIKFEKDKFTITRDIEDPTVIVKINTQDFLDIVDGKSSIIRKFLGRKMKFKKGITKLFKVYKIFSKMM